MAKWYKPSLSLAAKCRLGFSAAVLLIIGAALYVPFRWMDKLVEQGKLELARAEVKHVFRRHFHSEYLPGNSYAPPLTWLDEETNTLRASSTINDLERPLAGDVNGMNDAMGFSTYPRIQTRWTPYPLLSKDATDKIEAANNNEDNNGDANALKLDGQDRFIRRHLVKFEKDHERVEVFIPQSNIIEGGNDLPESPGFWEAFMPWAKPGRYLRAIRADRGCLADGCHAKSATDNDIDNDETSPSRPVFAEGDLVGVVSVYLPAGQTSVTLLFNRILIIMAGALAGICAIVTFYLITQQFILRPVRRLRNAAEKFSIPPDADKEAGTVDKNTWQDMLEITKEVQTGDEFEELAEAFGQLLTRLKLAHDRLEETNRALDLQLGELEAKNLALFESNKLKSEFLANVSHELRTPLNAIIGFTEILQERLSTDEKARRYVTNVLASGKMLLALINDLLDLAKIEAGRMEVHWAPCVITEVIEALQNFTRLLAEDKNLAITTDIDDTVGVIDTDQAKFQQILFNLLSNAIKFTPPGGHITITGRAIGEEEIEISVADTGPGISQQDQERIFEKFRQLDGSVTREYSGTGLGLAIVKELVGILGGAVRIESELGSGATFFIRLPRHRVYNDQ